MEEIFLMKDTPFAFNLLYKIINIILCVLVYVCARVRVCACVCAYIFIQML